MINATLIITWLLTLAVISAALWKRDALGWAIVTYVIITAFFFGSGITILHFAVSPLLAKYISIPYVFGLAMVTLGAIGILFGVVEFGLLTILGQFRLGAISRVTYYEALLQPFTIIIACAGIGAIALAAGLPYFTYNEDFKMYRDVGTSFVFLFSLPIMIFACTKVVDDEIENRTMLILMSKPVSRWQVILGKYLGILLLMLVIVLTLGIIAGLGGFLRYYDDAMMDYRVSIGFPKAVEALDLVNTKGLLALMPGLVLTFLQVATLSAVSVAVSTRFGLAANVTIVVLIYILDNLARYIQSIVDLPAPFAAIATMLTYLLPGLTLLDLNQRLVFGNYLLGHEDWASNGNSLPTYAHVWQYVGIATVYALFYIGAALSMGMALFRSRELS